MTVYSAAHIESNIGNSQKIRLLDFVAAMKNPWKEAVRNYLPMQRRCSCDVGRHLC